MKKLFENLPLAISLIVVVTAVLSVLGYREFVRLGSGSQFGLLPLAIESKVNVSDSFTHGSGPALSLAVNGRLDGLKFRLDGASAHDTIFWPSKSGTRIDLQATELKYESELQAKAPTPAHNLENTVMIESDFIQDHAIKGKPLSMRLSGAYFVAYLSLPDPSTFPDDGVISVIVN